MKNIIIFLFTCVLAFSATAQTLQIPLNCKLSTKKDYREQESNVLKAIEWLQLTPVDAEKELRELAQSFIVNWIMGSPTVSIELDERLCGAFTENPIILMTYLNGCTKYAIENKQKKFLFETHYSGVNHVLAFYKTNTGKITANETLDNYLSMQADNTLEEHLKNVFKK